eukprot:14864602-Alexandrium_andersonii.AAC.1
MAEGERGLALSVTGPQVPRAIQDQCAEHLGGGSDLEANQARNACPDLDVPHLKGSAQEELHLLER